MLVLTGGARLSRQPYSKSKPEAVVLIAWLGSTMHGNAFMKPYCFRFNSHTSLLVRQTKGMPKVHLTHHPRSTTSAALRHVASSGPRQPWRSILLYGPPGTGKVLSAREREMGRCDCLSGSNMCTHFLLLTIPVTPCSRSGASECE